MFLIAPVLFAAIVLGLPILSKLVVDLVGKKVPRRYKPIVAGAVGALAGLGAHLAGVPLGEVQALIGLTGPGAVAAHETWEMVSGRRYRKSVPSPEPRAPSPGQGPPGEKP